METIIIHPKDKGQLTTVKAILKALKVPFEKAMEESPYKPEFVKKIKHGDKDKKAGRFTSYTMYQLDQLCR